MKFIFILPHQTTVSYRCECKSGTNDCHYLITRLLTLAYVVMLGARWRVGVLGLSKYPPGKLCRTSKSIFVTKGPFLPGKGVSELTVSTVADHQLRAY